MLARHRLLTLLVVLALIGAPALAATALCLGKSCPKEPSGATAVVPFCPLPKDLRSLIEAGFRQGRSPDVFGVTVAPDVIGGEGQPAPGAVPVWPAADPPPSTAVPLIFAGTGVGRAGDVPPGAGLDDIAPTLAEMIGFERGHPELRAGQPIPGLTVGGEDPALVLEVALKGTGTADLEAHKKDWPVLRGLMKDGAGTLDATSGSLPVDSTASLTTIGTGGLPAQHGITGTLIRDKNGALVQAWSPHAPISVLATLPDDLVQQRPKTQVGIVEADPYDRGIIGGNWYIGEQPPQIDVARGRASVPAVERMLSGGDFGTDATSDFLAVTLRGSPKVTDARLGEIVAAAEEASGGSLTVVVAGTGGPGEIPGEGAMTGADIVGRVEQQLRAPGIIDTAIPGALFIDQEVSADEGIAAGEIVAGLDVVKGPDGKKVMAESFPAFSISFARYC